MGCVCVCVCVPKTESEKPNLKGYVFEQIWLAFVGHLGPGEGRGEKLVCLTNYWEGEQAIYEQEGDLGGIGQELL